MQFFGFVWLIFTVPFHLFYLNGKKSRAELKKQTEILEKQKADNLARQAADKANRIEKKIIEDQEKKKLATMSSEVEKASPADEILKLSKLKDDGIISEEEFEAKKKQLLALD